MAKHALKLTLAFGNTVPSPLYMEQGAPPDWLLSSYESLEWRVKQIGHQKVRVISWDLALGPHGRLPDYPHMLDTVKRIVYGIRTGKHATVDSGGEQYNTAQSFFCLIRWMLDRGVQSFSELTRRDIEVYKQGCPGGIEFLLNAPGRLRQLVESMVLAAGFEEGDTRELRVAKSLAVFPHRRTGGQIRLQRDDMLQKVGLNSRSSTLSPILDALEQDCGFYLDVTSRARLARVLQAQTQAEADLDDNDDDEEEEAQVSRKAPEDAVTDSRARMLLLPLTYLYSHRKFLEDRLQFHPFGHEQLKNVLKKLRLKSVERTPTAPVNQTITFIERSARWVLNYSRALLAMQKWAQMHEHEPQWRLQALVRRRSPRLEGPSSPFPIIHRGRDYFKEPSIGLTASAVALRKGMSLRTALTFLQTACTVVIAAFTARRAAEIRGLKANCIKRDASGKPWLHVFIHKTVRDYTLIPVPELVAKAVQVLTRLSKSARQQSGTDYLLQFTVPGSGGEVVGVSTQGEPVTKLTVSIERFGYFVDVPDMEDGTRWAFAPHQFRRFFAIMYIRAYAYGDIDALSYHLRHWNREQTRRYCSEKQVGREVLTANRERAAEVVAAAALGELRFDGHPRLVKAVERLCHRMARKVQVVTRRQVEARARRLLDRTKISMHAFPWGFCVSTIEGSESPSVCNRDGSAPMPDDASVSTCAECPKTLRGAPHRVYLVGSLKMHSELAADTNLVPMVREASAEMVKLLERVTSEQN